MGNFTPRESFLGNKDYIHWSRLTLPVTGKLRTLDTRPVRRIPTTETSHRYNVPIQCNSNVDGLESSDNYRPSRQLDTSKIGLLGH